MPFWSRCFSTLRSRAADPWSSRLRSLRLSFTPPAQEAIKGHLEDLAMRADVSLLVTTHSPYVISRSGEALVTELRKSPDGATSKAASAPGNESRADLLGSLYRDAGLARVLERSLEIPAGAKAVVVTEGYTDGLFLRQCCEAVGREDLLDGLHLIPAGRAANVVPQAILAEAATELPVIALLDYDESGKAAVEKLKSFNWEPAKRILSLRSWPGACPHHDIEIEDLLPVAPVSHTDRKVGRPTSRSTALRSVLEPGITGSARPGRRRPSCLCPPTSRRTTRVAWFGLPRKSGGALRRSPVRKQAHPLTERRPLSPRAASSDGIDGGPRKRRSD